MVLNIHFASGLLFQYALPDQRLRAARWLGGLLALALGAVGLPASLKRK